MEPIQQQRKVISLFPIQDQEFWQAYEMLLAVHWDTKEVSLREDRTTWKRLSKAEQKYYEYVFGFFATMDECVLTNLDDNFCDEVGITELKYFYRYQAVQEQIHSEAYSRQIEVIFEEEKDRLRVLTMGSTVPELKAIVDWIRFELAPERKHPLAERILINAVVESVLFQTHFLSIQLLKDRGLLPGVVTFNEFISRDEDLHFETACAVLKRFNRRPDVKWVHTIIKKAVELMDNFLHQACTDAAQYGNLDSLSEHLLKQHMRAYSTQVCQRLGYIPIYDNITSPYPEMDKLFLNATSKNHFLEQRPTEYQNLNSDSLTVTLKKEPWKPTV